MAKPSAERYYEAFKKSYTKLTNALPITYLLPYLYEANVVSGYLKAKLNAIPVCSDKVACLLDEMEGGLKAGIVDRFESFICTMEKYCTVNDDVVVKRLCEDIRSLITNEPPVKKSSLDLSTDKILGIVIKFHYGCATPTFVTSFASVLKLFKCK